MFLGRFLSCITLIAMVGHAQAANRFLCVAESAVGFTYSNAEGWHEMNADYDDEKFVLAPSGGEESAYSVTKLGNSSESFYCQEGINEYGNVVCPGALAGGFMGRFRANTTTGRFVLTYDIGFFSVKSENIGDLEKENEHNPHMIIGKCSPFEK